MKCVCDQPGYCEQFKRTMSPHLHHRCQTREDFRQTFYEIANGLPVTIKERPADLPPLEISPDRIPCIYIGPVISRAECNCPETFTFGCDHETQGPTTTLERCRDCARKKMGYEPDDQAKRLD